MLFLSLEPWVDLVNTVRLVIQVILVNLVKLVILMILANLVKLVILVELVLVNLVAGKLC